MIPVLAMEGKILFYLYFRDLRHWKKLLGSPDLLYDWILFSVYLVVFFFLFFIYFCNASDTNCHLWVWDWAFPERDHAGLTFSFLPCSIDCAGILKLRNSDIELRKGETDIGRKNTRVRVVFRVHIPQPNGKVLSLQAASIPVECCECFPASWRSKVVKIFIQKTV